MRIDMLTHSGKRRFLDYGIEELFQQMETYQIDASVICTQMEHHDNAHIHDLVMQYPSRLFGFGIVDPWALDCEEQLRRCFEEYHFKGLKINCLRHSVAADRWSMMEGHFRWCEKYHGIIIAHCMSDMFSVPVRWERMAKRFPNVPIILSHIGVPYMSESAIKIAARNTNIYLNTAACFPPILKQAYEVLGADKLLFASDTPFGSISQEERAIRYIINQEADYKKIMGENAEKLLREAGVIYANR